MRESGESVRNIIECASRLWPCDSLTVLLEPPISSALSFKYDLACHNGHVPVISEEHLIPTNFLYKNLDRVGPIDSHDTQRRTQL